MSLSAYILVGERGEVTRCLGLISLPAGYARGSKPDSLSLCEGSNIHIAVVLLCPFRKGTVVVDRHFVPKDGYNIGGGHGG